MVLKGTANQDENREFSFLTDKMLRTWWLVSVTVL